MISRKSLSIRLCLLAAIFAVSSGAVASSSQESISDAIMWREENSHLNLLRMLLRRSSVTKSNQSPENSSRGGTACTALFRFRSAELSACPQFYYSQSGYNDNPLFLGQLKSYLRRFPMTEEYKDWRNHFLLASAFVRIGEYNSAYAIVELAREKFSEQREGSPQLEQKFRLFKLLLAFVTNPREMSVRRLQEFASEQKFSPDHADFLSNALQDRIDKLPLRRGAYFIDDHSDLSHKDAVRSFVYEKWRVEQELDEVQALLSRSSSRQVDFDVVARANLLSEQFGVTSPEWLAIVNMAARVKNKSELVSRSSGPTAFLDAWATTHLADKFTKTINSDDAAVRASLVSRHLIPLFVKITKKLQSSDLRLSTDERVQAILQRLRAMQSRMHSVVDSLALDSELAAIQETMSTFMKSRSAMLRIKARIASLEERMPPDAERIQLLKELNIEHRELAEIQKNILQLIALRIHAYDPVVMASLRQTARRLNQLRSTLADLESIGTDVERGGVRPIFGELREFLSEIDSSIRTVEHRRLSESVGFAKISEPLQEKSDQLLADTEKFFLDSGPEINKSVRLILREVERRLYAERERFNFYIAQRKSLIQQDIENAAKQVEAKIKKINNLKRIRQENLEWRLSR